MSISFEAQSVAKPSQPKNLLDIPAEVRLHLYRILFRCHTHIPLDTDAHGRIVKTEKKLPLQFLLVCRRVYIEACPILYGINTFCVMHEDIPRLLHLRQASRVCIETVEINCYGKKNSSDTSGNHQSNLAEHINIEFDIISQALPYIQRLYVVVSNPSQFLPTVLKLANSLPCSTIRTWPVLQVDVFISNKKEYGVLSKQLQDKLRKIEHKLSALNSVTNLGLGHEMGNFSTIYVRGKLSQQFCDLIQNHVCSFGDCSFHVEEILLKDKGDILEEDDSVSEQEGSQNREARKENDKSVEESVLKHFRFIWHKNGNPIPQEPEEMSRILAGLHHWSPEMDKHWKDRLESAGFTVDKPNTDTISTSNTKQEKTRIVS